ncbi:DUF4839 domain-containing protein [Streptomyces sp. NPDC058049]|uniref:DUF4839 domain-containing protein n=1 Tax=Streptomyces sp. NPDC058049 TaxID=3346314 RepID=UPI0036EBE097
MADEIKYEYKTVKTVRGTNGLVISKLQKDGWELVEQAHGALRSTLDFRRPKKPLPRLLIGAAAAVLVILTIVIGTAAALGDAGEKKDESDKPAAMASGKPSATPTPTAAESAATEVITPQNNPEFAALLLKPDSCDNANLDFATRHKGRTVAFDGSIVNMAPHGDYDTRYDLLLGPGDKGPKTGGGPAFKYEDVNILDLKLTGKQIPAAVGAGDTFRFVAEVGEFNADQCLFFLDPVSTETR